MAASCSEQLFVAFQSLHKLVGNGSAGLVRKLKLNISRKEKMFKLQTAEVGIN